MAVSRLQNKEKVHTYLSVFLLKTSLKRDSLSPDTGGLKSLILFLTRASPLQTFINPGALGSQDF
jgi:hypothetical protein